MRIPSDALRNEPFRPLPAKPGKRVSIDRRSWFDRRFPGLSRACYLFLFPCSRFIAFLMLGYVIYAASWFVYSALPLVCPFLLFVCPFLLSALADAFSVFPTGVEGIALLFVAFVLFVSIIPPIVVGGIVLPTLKAVLALLGQPRD